MEKLSLFNFLSVLLPGALLTLVIKIICLDYGLDASAFNINDHFKLTVFLSVSIFLGALINITTRGLLWFLRKVGLYSTIYTIYTSSKELQLVRHYINSTIKKKYPQSSEEDGIENFWNEMYYELEAIEKINVPKTYQSFYFFFRNFFTLGTILLIPLAIQLIVSCFSAKYVLLILVTLLGMILSIMAGR